MTVKAKTKKVKLEEHVNRCHFCPRDDRLARVRLIVGSEDRLVLACPNHR